MSQEFCDTRDPGLSTLDFGKTYSIVGIVNGPFDSAAFQTGVMVLRIPLITIAQTQIMIEIWNKNVEMEPRLAKNWQILQLGVFQGVRYYGKKTIEQKEIHIFRLSSQNFHQRFIWLSPDRPDFWVEPFTHDNITGFIHNQANNRAYLTTTVAEGWLDHSRGSVFGSRWKSGTRLHSKVKMNFYAIT